MRAIVIVAGRSPALQPLSTLLPPALLPCVDRPVLQHLIEYLVDRGFSEFDLVLHESAERIEEYFGDGSRWGSRFTFHLAQDPRRPYRSLRVIQEQEETAPILLVHADRLPLLAEPLGAHSGLNQDRLYYHKQPDSLPEKWTGWGWLTAATYRSVPADATERDLEENLHSRGALRDMTSARSLLDFSTLESMLLAQRQILSDAETNSHLSARQIEPGIWVARNVVIHPTARLVAPVFIGENSRIGKGATIGPNAVVSHDSIIDTHSTVTDSAVYPGSYCGEGLALDHVIVNRNRLMDGHLHTLVNVSDNFILGALKAREKKMILRSLVSCAIGLVLLIATLPLTFLTVVALFLLRKGPVGYRKPVVQIPAGEEPDTWESFDLWTFRKPQTPRTANAWQWFFLDFLPALPQVATGRVRVIGVQARSKAEIEELPEDWRSLYLRAYAGLITEAFVLHGMAPTEDEVYSSEVYYSAMSSMNHDLSLAMRFMTRIAAH